MASKKDLLEAQKFNRSRLLSAFLGGAPGGKELEPTNPLRAVFGSIMLTAMVLIVGLFLGFFQPALPSGWENNKLIVANDTGARYVSMDSTLYPVINTVSARLLIPPGEFSVISVNQSVLSEIPTGGTIGIHGGPDALPGNDNLDGRNWVACSSPRHTEAWIGEHQPTPAGQDIGRVVEFENSHYVITDGKSFEIPDKHLSSVLRVVGLANAPVTEVPGEWLALFEPGESLAPLEVEGAGEEHEAAEFPVGTVFHQTGTAESDLFMLTQDGALSSISPLAFRLFQLGDGSGTLGEVQEVSPSQLADLPTAAQTSGRGWPQEPMTPSSHSGTPCAMLEGSDDALRTVLVEDHDYSLTDQQSDSPVITHIQEGSGAVVHSGDDGTLTLIDPLGISYAIPGPAAESLERLDYEQEQVTAVPYPWLQLFPAGPALTPEAAGSSPGSS